MVKMADNEKYKDNIIERKKKLCIECEIRLEKERWKRKKCKIKIRK